jgi:polygalacturonase
VVPAAAGDYLDELDLLLNLITSSSLARRLRLAEVIVVVATALTSYAQASDASPAAAAPALGARVYNVRDFGARGDGTTLDTTAVQAAIDACNRDRGGTVLVPAGDFLIGTIELKSNITLHLSAQGRLLGSADIAHYRAGRDIPRGNGNIVLISAANAENITIEGPGTIDGQGAKFLAGAKDDGEREPGRTRAHLLVFFKCRNLRLRDALLTNSSYHCVRILQCSEVAIDGVRINNRVIFNNDGFHFNSSEHVKMSNCHIVCEDDACALFGSNRDITVTNCTFSTRWSVFRFGGGQCEGITVSNCVITDTFGCPIKMQVRSGDRMENMIFSNLVMQNVTGPIYIGLGSAPRNALNPNQIRAGGIVRNIQFRGITATVAAQPDLTNFPYLPGTPISDIYPGEHHTCINLTSVPGQVIENITLSDVNVTYAGGGTTETAAVRDVPQVSGGEYFACGVLPAYGLFARNVRGLTLNNVRFAVASPDARPAVVFDHVADVAINGLTAQGDPRSELLRFIDTQGVLLTATRVATPAAVFLQLEGPDNAAIAVDGGDLTKAAKPLTFVRGAIETAVRRRQ